MSESDDENYQLNFQRRLKSILSNTEKRVEIKITEIKFVQIKTVEKNLSNTNCKIKEHSQRTKTKTIWQPLKAIELKKLYSNASAFYHSNNSNDIMLEDNLFLTKF